MPVIEVLKVILALDPPKTRDVLSKKDATRKPTKKKAAKTSIARIEFLHAAPSKAGGSIR